MGTVYQARGTVLKVVAIQMVSRLRWALSWSQLYTGGLRTSGYTTVFVIRKYCFRPPFWVFIYKILRVHTLKTMSWNRSSFYYLEIVIIQHSLQYSLNWYTLAQWQQPLNCRHRALNPETFFRESTRLATTLWTHTEIDILTWTIRCNCVKIDFAFLFVGFVCLMLPSWPGLSWKPQWDFPLVK